MSTVLITGPTAGIGKSLAIQMAEKGHDLLLVARRGHRLEEISSDLKEKYNVNVNYFVADLNPLLEGRLQYFCLQVCYHLVVLEK